MKNFFKPLLVTICIFMIASITIIGAAAVELLPGDINSDGKVNLKDVVVLSRYIAGWDVEINEALLDVNGDGTVDNYDIEHLFKYASDWQDITLQTRVNELEYTLNSDGGSYSVTGIGTCTDTEILIPTSYNGKPVTSIGVAAFEGCSNLVGITIPDTVTYIGGWAFNGCSSLANINIPTDITSIESHTFYGCSSLTSITIPEGTTSIGEGAFDGCSNLVCITIPESVTTIDGWAFQYCSNLNNITIPAGVTSIESYTFSGCSSLTSITIPEGTTSIGEGAFDGCSNLVCITIPESVTTIDGWAFRYCSNLNNITIPAGVTSIESYTFSFCSNLASITIPEGVTSIGEGAFYYCDKLNVYYVGTQEDFDTIYFGNYNDKEIVYCYSETAPIVEGNFWHYVDGVPTVWEKATFGSAGLEYLLNSDNESYYVARVGACTDTEVIIPAIYNGKPVTSIGKSAFFKCANITSVTIPGSISSIGEAAFYGCESLTNLSLPNGITTIGSDTFSGCKSLTGITIPNSVEAIHMSAFYGCTNLSSITIPANVTSIDKWAFDSCSSLTNLYYIGTESDWNAIDIASDNEPLATATIYYYSETAPTVEGNFWHYVDGVPTVWEIHIHTEVIDAAVPATCTETGLTEGKHCSACNAMIVEQEIVPVIDHIEGEWIVEREATNYEDGIKRQICSVCNNTIKTQTIYATGSEGLVFELDKYGTSYIVTGIGTCTDIDLVIPTYYNGLLVTMIGQSAFAHNTQLVSVRFPGGLTHIEAGAFLGCTELRYLDISQTDCTYIKADAFGGCKNIKYCVMPYTLVKLHMDTFLSSSMQSLFLNIPECLDDAWKGTSPHYNVYGNKYWSYVDGIPTINGHTHSVKTIPSSEPTCTSLGFTEGSYCSSCGVSIVKQKASPMIEHTESGWIVDKTATKADNGSKHTECTMCHMVMQTKTIYATGSDGLVYYHLNNDTTSVYLCSIKDCTDTDIVIPAYYAGYPVIGIGLKAFQNNDNVTSITILGNISVIDSQEFYDCESLREVTILGKTQEIRSSAFAGCVSLTNITLPDTLIKINGSAFENCSSLNSIIIPDSVTYIGTNAFEGCTSLTTAVISKNVEGLWNTFKNCSKLDNVIIPEGVKWIGQETFYNCSSLTNITIPSSITGIRNYAFIGCTALKTVNFNGTIEQWNNIEKPQNWNKDCPLVVIHCTDGDVSVS